MQKANASRNSPVTPLKEADVIAEISHRLAFAPLGRAIVRAGVLRFFCYLLVIASVTGIAHAQRKDSPNQASCLRMSQLQYLETLEQECQHLARASNFNEIISSWHKACYLGVGPNRQSEDYVRWHTSNRSQQDQICRGAIEALKQNPRHFEGLLLYRR